MCRKGGPFPGKVGQCANALKRERREEKQGEREKVECDGEWC